MATRTATTRRASAAKAAEPETVEVEDEDEFEDMEADETDTEETDDDLEELEDDEEVEEAPAPKGKKTAAKRQPPKQPVIAFGSAELAAHVTETTGETYDARAIRMLLRKLAKDEKFKRVIGEDRSRYSFSGPSDPVVVLVVDMVKSGAAKELKQAGLQAVKDKAAEKKALAKAAKAAEAEAEDDDDMEEEVEAPAPKRRTATKTAAPAKAQPSRRRAAAAAK